MANDAACKVNQAAVVVALVAGTLGPAVLLILPTFIGVLARDYSLSDEQLGVFSFSNLGGLALGSGVGASLFPKTGIRLTTGCGFVLAFAANVAMVFARAYSALLMLSVVSGIGGGLAVAVCYAVLGRSKHVDRNFGIYVACQVLFSALAIYSMPKVADLMGAPGIFGLMAALLLLSLPLVGYLPPLRGAALHDAAAGRIVRSVWVALCAVFAFFTAQGAVWTYLEIIGVRGGVDPQIVANGLAIATLAGVLGPIISAGLGARIGRALPLLVGVGLMIGASQMISSPLGPFRFGLSACLFTIAWNLTIPYQLSSISAVDQSGQAVAWAASISLAGLALGPLTAAVVLSDLGLLGVVWLSAALFIASFLGMIPVLHTAPPKRSTKSAVVTTG